MVMQVQLTIFQKGFNYSQDGPGNRLVLHLQGCNMNCLWCANPEGISKINPLKSPRVLDVAEVLEEIISCRSLFFDGGGVTFSGGEPTLQFDSLLKLLQQLQQYEVHTALETNGTHPRLEVLFPYLSMLVMDLKQVDDEVHRKWTGVSNGIIKENVGKAMSKHTNVLIRTPLIRGINSAENDISQFLAFYRQFPLNHTRFEFLKYHEYGKIKWEQCHKNYLIQDGYITEEILEKYEKAYRNQGLTVVRT